MNAVVEVHWAVDASQHGWAVADMEGRLVAQGPWTDQSQEAIRKMHAKEFFAAKMAVFIAHQMEVKVLRLYGDNDYIYSNREELERQHPNMKVEVVMLRKETNPSGKFNPADYWSKNFKLDGRLGLQDWNENMGNLLKEMKATNGMIRKHFADKKLLEEKKAESSFGKEEILKIRLDDLGVSTRLSNLSRTNNIVTIGDLIKHSPKNLLRMPNFGPGCLSEVVQLLDRIENKYDVVLGWGSAL